MPAITGNSSTREAISTGQDGRPTSANTNTAITITHSRKAVPQRTWILEYDCTLSGVSSAPSSKALIALCSAAWYWKTRRRSGTSEITAR